MRKSEIVGKFGETFVASLLYNLGYKVDMIDENGIDLACYKENKLLMILSILIMNQN